jgi:hypothetical protein
MTEIRCSVFSKPQPWTEIILPGEHRRQSVANIEFIVVNRGLTAISWRVR